MTTKHDKTGSIACCLPWSDQLSGFGGNASVIKNLCQEGRDRESQGESPFEAMADSQIVLGGIKSSLCKKFRPVSSFITN